MYRITLARMVVAVAMAVHFGFFTPAIVAAEETESTQLETMTVYAQKREENVQETPLSVGVLNDLRLEEERVSQLYDLNRLIPNLYMGSAGGSGTFTYVGIRGRINGDADVDPTVTVLVDGVPYDDFYSMGNNLLYDVERVEVLRGPQSTMYGLNSIAGVINIVTKKPGETTRGKVYVEGSAGPDWDGSWQAGGSVSGPLVHNTLYAGLSFLHKKQGGYIENKLTKDRYNDDRTTGVKGDLLWTPSDPWEVSLGVAYSKYDGDYSETYLPTNRAAAAAVGTDFEEWQADTGWEGDCDVETWAPNMKVSYDGGDFKIISVSAYRKATQEFDFDPYLSPVTGYLGYIDHRAETFTQELRVQSDDDEASNLQWLGGYSFNDFERKEKLGWALTATPSQMNFFKDSTLEGMSNAFFGQATYRFFDKALGLTAGGRQEWTEREAQSHLGLFADDTVSDSQFLPKLTLDYRVSPKVMIYAGITQGWRSGGMNMLASNTSQSKYKKETSWSYEIGLKTELFNNRLTFNSSAFYATYDDFQDLVYVNAGTAYLTNAPEVRMTGFETEITARLTQDLLLTGSLGYVHAEYVDFPDAAHGDFNGNRVMFVPDFNAHLALNYNFLGNFYVRPEVQGIGTLYWDRANSKKQSPYALFNLKAGYTGDSYEIYLFAENLTNKYAFSQATDYVGNGNYYGTPITPLRVGIGASITF
ncbi:TonB-dependent receptor [uncultured Desulfuromonas sp.]|uniref:TonB-dependent receptor n=1 Tax=uncultured Desulfuromonas sp. TaxID=181013 RepID=UPI002AAB3872|nr:TonB-dependent receptor [uncultured Desulfuromonas sp.]